MVVTYCYILLQGEGQPPLHKAVLRGCYEIVEMLAETLVYQKKIRLDSIRDQVGFLNEIVNPTAAKLPSTRLGRLW